MHVTLKIQIKSIHFCFVNFYSVYVGTQKARDFHANKTTMSGFNDIKIINDNEF